MSEGTTSKWKEHCREKKVFSCGDDILFTNGSVKRIPIEYSFSCNLHMSEDIDSISSRDGKRSAKTPDGLITSTVLLPLFWEGILGPCTTSSSKTVRVLLPRSITTS